jgi:hypothetical protein
MGIRRSPVAPSMNAAATVVYIARHIRGSVDREVR